MIGASHQNVFVNRMKNKNKNITDSPPKITKSISEMTYKQASISPVMPIRNRKRKRSPSKLIDFAYDTNNRPSKRLKISQKSPKRSRNNKNRESQYIEETYPMNESKSFNDISNGLLLNEENIGCLGETPSEIGSVSSGDLLCIAISASSSQSPLLSNKKKILNKKRVMEKQMSLPIMISPSKSAQSKSPQSKSPQSKSSQHTFDDAMDVDVLSTKYTNSVSSESKSIRSTQQDVIDDDNNEENEENEDQDAKMSSMELDDKEITPDGHDENGHDENGKYPIYKTFNDDDHKRPFFLSQKRVKHRSIMIYKQENWERDKLQKFLNIIDLLKMKRVYNIFNAKYIVIDSNMMGNDIKEEILHKLAIEYKNGCHYVREVYYDHIFKELCNKPGIRGVWFTNNPKRYFIVSTLNITKKYLKDKRLWPLQPKINHDNTR